MKSQTCEKYSQISPSMTNNDVIDSLHSSKVEKNCVKLNLSRKNSNKNEKLTETSFSSQF